MYAIIATGGKQYKVSEGDIIKVEKLGAEAGTTYTFDQVLAVSNDGLKIGNPVVEGASVEASVLGDGKAKKLSFTNTNRRQATTRKTATDSSIRLLRLKRSTLNP